VTVVPQIDSSLHRHTGNSTFAYSRNVNNAPANSTSASLGCSVFSEQNDASCPARTMYAVRYQCSACSVVCQRGVAQALQDVLLFPTRDRAGDAARTRGSCTTATLFVYLHSLISQDSSRPKLGRGRNVLVLLSFRWWSRAFVHRPEQVFIPFDGEHLLSHAEQTKVRSHRNAWRLRNAR
jgi:hypothetical protein